MKVLLDHNVPAQLKQLLKGHATSTARDMQRERLENGDLLVAAVAAGFEVMVTGDRNLSYQQNNSKRVLSLVVITQTKRRIVTAHHEAIAEALSRARPGSYELVPMPDERKGIRAVE